MCEMRLDWRNLVARSYLVHVSRLMSGVAVMRPVLRPGTVAVPPPAAAQLPT